MRHPGYRSLSAGPQSRKGHNRLMAHAEKGNILWLWHGLENWHRQEKCHWLDNSTLSLRT